MGRAGARGQRDGLAESCLVPQTTQGQGQVSCRAPGFSKTPSTSLYTNQEKQPWAPSSWGICRKNVRDEQCLGSGGGRGSACAPGTFRLAVLLLCRPRFCHPAAPPQGHVHPHGLTSDRGNGRVLLTALYAKNYLENGWFQGIGTT